MSVAKYTYFRLLPLSKQWTLSVIVLVIFGDLMQDVKRVALRSLQGKSFMRAHKS